MERSLRDASFGGASFISSESKLIGSPSLASRSSSSINYIPFFLLFCLALPYLVWLGSATGHRSHTHTNAPFTT